MIYLLTALYCEARIFIQQFHLEKNPKNTRFQEFNNETAGIRLTVTGIGEIAAAAAVAGMCTEYKPGRQDVLINIGTCAHVKGTAGIYLCNKIMEQTTGKTFYPDMLYDHDFREEEIVTGMLPWNGEKAISKGNLYDMEAAAIYQAGSYFFGPHQMMFLKIVSDGGTAKDISERQVEDLMERNQDVLFRFVERIWRIEQNSSQTDGCLQQEKEELIGRLCTDLHCSKVMRDSLRQHIHYLALVGTDYVSVIQEMYQEGILPCRDKREGKLCFEELKRRLL